MLNIFYKPNGQEIKVNDQSFSHAVDLGWTTEKPEEEKKPSKNKKAK